MTNYVLALKILFWLTLTFALTFRETRENVKLFNIWLKRYVSWSNNIHVFLLLLH